MKNGLYEDEYGNKVYYLNGQYHREDGPAIEWAGGGKEWYQNGKRHRLDGPAVEYAYFDGPAVKYSTVAWWYYQGKNIDCNSQEEFEKLIKLMAFW